MSTYKKLQVVELSSDFTAATRVVECPLHPPAAGQLLIRAKYVGTNATDINITAGRYFTDGKVPFDIGFEAVGSVSQVGEGVTGFQPGDTVLAMGGRYAEYSYIDVGKSVVLKVPEAKPEYLSLLVTGLTATLGLDKQGQIKSGEKVLITAAAGATGLTCVQWAKLRGCHVIATTSNDDKAAMLKTLGADRVINYKTENMDEVLTKEYPDGVDVIWETIGGKTFEMLSRHLAIKGRLVIVGAITGYKTEGFPPVDLPRFPGELLMKSASFVGFLLTNFGSDFQEYLSKMMTLHGEGKLKFIVDEGQSAEGGPFVGIEACSRAVAHLHAGANLGKVVTRLY